jgi:adenylate kinase family enzyme
VPGFAARDVFAMDLPPLSDFGSRIMICGTSNAGKSTLALAIGGKLGISAVHLDQLRFLPGTDWQERPDAKFKALHDAAIESDSWVMDGNYSFLTPQRLARATGILLVHDNRFANFRRYLWRTLFQRDRAGALEGSKDSLKWSMVHWLLVGGPRRIAAYRQKLCAAGRPFLELSSMRELKRLYTAWGLTRP